MANTHLSSFVDNNVVCYFNITEFSATEGALFLSSDSLKFSGNNHKDLEIPINEIKEAKFSYYIKDRKQNVLSGPAEHIVSYRLLIKVQDHNYRLHFQKEETRQKLLAIFKQNKIMVKGEKNNKTLLQVNNRNKKTKIILYTIAILVGFTIGLIAK